jgi:hypothetical protein
MITRRSLHRALVAGAALWAAGGGRALADANELDYPPNVFISPCGKPFRARITEPYPVAAWFKAADKTGDGKLDRDEFVADAEAFFGELDVNGDGKLDGSDIRRYERQIAPEVLGQRVMLGAARYVPGLQGGRLWLAQTIQGNAPIAPQDDDPLVRPPHDIDESGEGASPYGFFAEPEPVMAADESLNGIIKKAAFLRLAERHYDRLDSDGVGYLTLAKLPKTAIQTRVERAQRGLRRS